MTAGVLSFCGATGGKMCGATSANKKGQFENMEVRNLLIKPYLKEIGADPMGQNPLPTPVQIKPFYELRPKMQHVLYNQGYRDEKPWFFKGAKICLIWPVFSSAFPRSKWIIVRRKDEDIINSCLRTGFMRAYRNREGWQGWVDTHKQRFKEMKTYLKDNVREVWPSKFVEGDFSEIKEVVKWVGLQWNEKAILEFVSPELWCKGGRT